ncbi:MAG: NADH-quinone oxidoreductase subunit C [Deltaproteobacteria bacterium]|nr:NADH-quinone oxidoreductase subunit C [Deltaproteobacteria bacterium]
MMNLLEILQKEFGEAVGEVHQNYGDDTAVVDSSRIVDILKFLKEFPECPFDLFLDLCGVDYLAQSASGGRFEVVYHLYSLPKKKRIRLRVKIAGEKPSIQSAVPVYPIADWFEREAYDLLGIRFEGHPNLKRLLMWEGFEGHPLRKDYPIDKRQPIPTLGNLL